MFFIEKTESGAWKLLKKMLSGRRDHECKWCSSREIRGVIEGCDDPQTEWAVCTKTAALRLEREIGATIVRVSKRDAFTRLASPSSVGEFVRIGVIGRSGKHPSRWLEVS
jgi:hypothetical protein